MMSPLHRPVCDLLGCTYPIVLAGMGGVARSGLVIAVTEAGGFGFLGMVRESPDLIREEIAKVRAATARDFGVNLIPAATKPDLLEAELAACIEARVPVMALFWDLSADVVKRLRDAGILVVVQVGSAKEAWDAQKAGAQVLIAQGIEAGGHVRGLTKRSELLRDVFAISDVPVLASGGIANGVEIAAAMAQGAQGAVLGTAFLATAESFAHDYHKQRIVEAEPGSTVHTQDFHVNWPKGAYVRVLPNSVTEGRRGDPFAGNREAIGKEGARTIWLYSTDSPLQSMTGDFEAMALYAGEGAGAIQGIVPAGVRVRDLVAETEHALSASNRETRVAASHAEPASPVCYLNEADDAYAGFASRDELAATLNELLEAERAGARICARTALETGDEDIRALMRLVHADEVRWCRMLLAAIEGIGAEPSSKVGAFYEKCLAIADLKARIAFINRGQGWVSQKLREILPKVRDDALHAALKTMLESHDANIAKANAALA
jgi:nitronate monooxygenase